MGAFTPEHFSLAIATVFQREGLSGHLERMVRSAFTLTAVVRLYNPTAARMSKAMRTASPIAATIGTEVSTRQEKGRILIEANTPDARIVNGLRLAGKGINVPIGVDSLRRPVGWRPDVDYHLLAVGPTRGGKSTAMRTILYHLMQQNPPIQQQSRNSVGFAIAAIKFASWTPFKNQPHSLGVTSDPEEITDMIHWFNEITVKRLKTATATPHLFLVVDDLPLVLSQSPSVEAPLRNISSAGGGAGVHLLVGTQRLGKDAGSPLLAANLVSRIVVGSTDGAEAARNTGRTQSGANHLSSHPGDALFISANGMKRIAVGFIPDHSISPGSSPEPKPWKNVKSTPQPTPQPTGKAIDQNGKPLLTPDVIRKVQQVYARTHNKTYTCKAVWGFKNGDTWNLLHQALETQL